MKGTKTIAQKTADLDIKMSGTLVMTSEEWTERGGVNHGAVGQAARAGWYTARECKKLGQPVTDEEFAKAQDFAMVVGGDLATCLIRNGKYKRPCVPVFYRRKEGDHKNE